MSYFLKKQRIAYTEKVIASTAFSVYKQNFTAQELKN